MDAIVFSTQINGTSISENMKTESFELTAAFPTTAQRLYTAWLNSEEHGNFTGGEANIDAIVGSEYSAWDEYITGKILELEPGRRILQTWRTSEFEDSDEDSLLEILLSDTDNGCLLTLKHWDIPAGQGKSYEAGWEEHYFSPMRSYFANKPA